MLEGRLAKTEAVSGYISEQKCTVLDILGAGSPRGGIGGGRDGGRERPSYSSPDWSHFRTVHEFAMESSMYVLTTVNLGKFPCEHMKHLRRAFPCRHWVAFLAYTMSTKQGLDLDD